MRFEYAGHARFRMMVRNIDEKTVEDVINNPEYVGRGRGERMVAYKKVGNEKIRIAYIRKPHKILVITIMTR